MEGLLSGIDNHTKRVGCILYLNKAKTAAYARRNLATDGFRKLFALFGDGSHLAPSDGLYCLQVALLKCVDEITRFSFSDMQIPT